MDFDLNENDAKLLGFCKDRPKTIKDISEHLGIAQKNVFVRLAKLEKAKLIEIKKSPSLKKIYIKTIEDEKIKKYTLELLNALKENNGEMNFEYFCMLSPLNPFEPESYNRNIAFNTILYSSPSLVKKKFYLTEEGLNFLKENETNNKN